MSEQGVSIDPIEPTEIAPGLVAIPMSPTVWDDLEDGQHAVTANGIVFQRRDGLWHMNPWWQDDGDGAEIAAICADPDEWAYDMGWPRKQVEDAHGPLTPITLPKIRGAVDADAVARVEALTWFPALRDTVSGRVTPPRRKTHVRVRDLLAALAPEPDDTDQTDAEEQR